MNSGTLAKIFGWLQFGVSTLGSVVGSPQPHGWANWVQFAASLAAAVGIHAASNSGPATTNGTTATKN